MSANPKLYEDLVKLTTTKDEKAELTLVAELEDKSRQEKRQICKFLDCPWEEYQRIRRKYSKVIERWNAEEEKKTNYDSKEII